MAYLHTYIIDVKRELTNYIPQGVFIPDERPLRRRRSSQSFPGDTECKVPGMRSTKPINRKTI